MNLTALLALIRKDVQLYFTDRRALLMTIGLPIAFASFFGILFGGKQGDSKASAIPLLWVDEDQSPLTQEIRKNLGADSSLSVEDTLAADARARVGAGKSAVAVVVPRGFGAQAGQAFFGGANKAQVAMLRDPSHGTELAMVRGLLTEHVMQAVSRQAFSAEGGAPLVKSSLDSLESNAQLPPAQKQALRELLSSVNRYYQAAPADAAGADGKQGGLSMPYEVAEEALTSPSNTAYNGFSHAFAGNGVQFVLFGAVEAGVGLLTERQRGIWRRLRAAPVSRATLLLAKVLSAALLALFSLLLLYTFGRLVFGVRIEGSVVGFVLMCLAYALTAGTFGLMVATLGKTPAAARGGSIFVVLMMSMLGGSMVPVFLFPAWMQQLTRAVPTRWALDGLEAVTWRGQGVEAAWLPAAVLLGFSAAFATVALTRFRWEED